MDRENKVGCILERRRQEARKRVVYMLNFFGCFMVLYGNGVGTGHDIVFISTLKGKETGGTAAYTYCIIRVGVMLTANHCRKGEPSA